MRAIQHFTIGTFAHRNGGAWAMEIVTARVNFMECSFARGFKHYDALCKRFYRFASIDPTSW